MQSQFLGVVFSVLYSSPTRGCIRNEALSSDLSTVCECTHLSQVPHVSIPLSIFGYLGVTVSVMTLMMTIVTFTVVE